MVGGLLCSPEHVLNNSATGGAGSILKLKRAVRLPRYILVSAEASHTRTPMVDFMCRAQEWVGRTARERGSPARCRAGGGSTIQQNISASFRRSLASEGKPTNTRWLFWTTNDELAHLPQRCTTHAFVNNIFRRVDARFTRLGLGPR